MKYSGWKSLKLQSVSTPVRCLAGIVAIFLVGWLYLANLACVEGLLTSISIYIKFSPPSLVIERPGQQATVETELEQGGADTTIITDPSWSILPGVPPIVESARCSPPEGDIRTQLSLKLSSNPSLFGATDLWNASVSNAYQVGVKAVFDYISGSEKVTSNRTAYFPLRSGTSRFVVTQALQPSGYFKFFITIENPIEGWHYYYETEEKAIKKDGSAESLKCGSEEISLESPGYLPTLFNKNHHNSSSVRLTLTIKDKDKVIKTEVRNFQLSTAAP